MNLRLYDTRQAMVLAVKIETMEQKPYLLDSVKSEKNARLSLADLRCIDQALEYIEKHYSEKISADQLSLEVGLSKEKLQAGLQYRTSLTLHKYIQQIRMGKARELLANTNHPVKAIADAAGFVNESHFCKVVRKIYRTSPVQYRYQQVV